MARRPPQPRPAISNIRHRRLVSLSWSRSVHDQQSFFSKILVNTKSILTGGRVVNLEGLGCEGSARCIGVERRRRRARHRAGTPQPTRPGPSQERRRRHRDCARSLPLLFAAVEQTEAQESHGPRFVDAVWIIFSYFCDICFFFIFCFDFTNFCII